MQTAFQKPLLINVSKKPRNRIGTPTCSHNKEFATAALAAVTISLSTLPIRPGLSDALPSQDTQQSLVINTGHTETNACNALVVGVGKAAIHDYSYGDTEHVRVPTVARSVEQVDEDARDEFSLAVRLVTAVLLGVMLGVERRATKLNLGVRSITLISLSAAMTTLLAKSIESGITGILSLAPHITIIGTAALTGSLVYMVARLRERRTRHIGAMCWTIGLGVAMGAACGAGLSLLTVICYLAAVAVMRSDSGGRRESGVRHSLEELRLRVDDVVNVNVIKRDGVDGKGVSI